MTREEMLTEVIRKYGFEAPETIRFASYLERFHEDAIMVAYQWLMNKPLN